MLRIASVLGRSAVRGQIRVCTRRYSSPADSATPPNVKMIGFTFINKDGSKKEVKVPMGTNVLEAAHKNDVDLEGACEASLACSTCHVYVEKKYFSKLPEPTDEENDMLDLAFELKENSRLGCQVVLTPELEGMEVTLPPATRNMAVDGYKPPKH